MNHIPVLDYNPVLHTNDVGCNPFHRLTKARNPPVDDYEISFGYDGSGFILKCWWAAFNEVEQALATRRDGSTVLDVFG